MDTRFELNGITFVWDDAKALTNLKDHGVSFEQAAEVFFDPFVRFLEASRADELREAAIGCDFQYRVLFVVHLLLEGERVRIVSARRATTSEETYYEI